MFVASRRSTTPMAQHEFWLEFFWLDQEYRAAVRRLARFCRLTPPISAHSAPAAAARSECRSSK
jgi:hypothetical protein